MYLLFVILIVIASLLMIGIVLIQESKGGGLSSNFSSSNQVLGVRKTTDFIEKATWGLAIAMVVLSVVCAAVKPEGVKTQSAVETEQTLPPATQPGFGVSNPGQVQGQATPAAQGEAGGQAATPPAAKTPSNAPAEPAAPAENAGK